MKKTFIITEKEYAEFEHLKNTYANCEICMRDFTKTVEMLKRQNKDLRNQNVYLKANANKVAIEKLEELLEFTHDEIVPQPQYGHKPYDKHNRALIVVYEKVHSIIKELKGEKDE